MPSQTGCCIWIEMRGARSIVARTLCPWRRFPPGDRKMDVSLVVPLQTVSSTSCSWSNENLRWRHLKSIFFPLSPPRLFFYAIALLLSCSLHWFYWNDASKRWLHCHEETTWHASAEASVHTIISSEKLNKLIVPGRFSQGSGKNDGLNLKLVQTVCCFYFILSLTNDIYVLHLMKSSSLFSSWWGRGGAGADGCRRRPEW